MIITEETTLAELREQLRLLDVISLRIYPSLAAALEGHPALLEASVHHATGFHAGRGLTEATAIEAAFVKLRHALLPESLQQYLAEIETKS